MRGPAASRGVERRIDPADSQVRTFQELEALCTGHYSPEEIREYWDTVCLPPQSEAAHNVQNDPFLTHTQRRPRAGADQQMTNVAEDPFMTHRLNAAQLGPVGQTQGPESRTLPPQSSTLPPQSRTPPPPQRHWSVVLFSVLGPGDTDRKQSASTIMIFGPWLLFTWTMFLWLVLQHYSQHVCGLLSGVLTAASFAMVAMWYIGKRWGPVSLLALGALCLLASIAGTGVGRAGWDRYWRQYWWTQTGHRFKGTTAATPAGSRVDASVVEFWDSDAGDRTLNGTAVDHLKSAGFKDDHFYCVAPVLDPEAAGVSIARVNYWAVGIDCCQHLGSFTCDDSRDFRGGYGVVMLEAGYPCPGCNEDKFRAAVLKAETMHGLLSAPGALFVRWVRDPGSVQTGLFWQGLLFMALSTAIAFSVFLVLGAFMWYYGIGKRALPTAGMVDARQVLLK